MKLEQEDVQDRGGGLEEAVQRRGRPEDVAEAPGSRPFTLGHRAPLHNAGTVGRSRLPGRLCPGLSLRVHRDVRKKKGSLGEGR